MQDIGKYYVINHLILLTGLTDRTIRNYIASGILVGEKINGVWHFTKEQVESFICHPAVRPSIIAKNNSLVYDFLLEDKKKQREICMILDIPCEDKKSVAEFFGYRIARDEYRDIRFVFDGVRECVRVIIKGDAAKVLQLVNEYYSNE